MNKKTRMIHTQLFTPSEGAARGLMNRRDFSICHSWSEQNYDFKYR